MMADEIEDWFAATRPDAPSPALRAAVAAAAEAERRRPALRWRDLPALAASALIGLWLGYAPLTTTEELPAALDLADALQWEESP